MDSRFEIGSVYSPAVLDADQQLLTSHYMEKLRQIDSHALGFIPFSAFGEHIRKNRVIIETENNEPCGFLIWSKMKIRIKILMICIQEDARRIIHATNLIRGMLELQDSWDTLYIQLRCADDLESNKFWKSLEFKHITQVDGGGKKCILTKPKRGSLDEAVDKLLGETQIRDFQKAKITFRRINVYRLWIKESSHFALQGLEKRVRCFPPQRG